MCVCLTWENSDEMTYGIVASGHRRHESLRMGKVSEEAFTTIPKSPDGIPILRLSFSHHLLKVIWQHICNVSLENVLVILNR